MGGGKLFIGLAQFAITTNRDDIDSYKLTYTDHPFANKVMGKVEFVEDSLDGKTIRVNANIPEGRL